MNAGQFPHTFTTMSSERLREAQAPLKARYKETPSSALVTLRASGRVSQEKLTFTLETGKPGVPAGLHPATGGDGTAACSGDMLLEALVSCAGVTLAAVATSMGIAMTSAVVSAEGDLDFRGTLGVAKDAPVGFTRIAVTFTIDSATRDKLPKLLELTDRYCVVAQTLAHATPIKMTLSPEA
jgi:uncharacterized OsmC-like protein